MYRYIFDNNEQYPEDHNSVELLCSEKLTPDEFEHLVHQAFELCGGNDVWYEDVAAKIVEIDNRFSFPPQPVSIAYIGLDYDNDDYDSKIRGVYHK